MIFENPEQYGYRFFYRTLREHRMAMLMPSWKYALNYETDWMSRDEIVRATYDGALALLDLKERYGVIAKSCARRIRDHLATVALSNKIPDPDAVNEALREEILQLNTRDLVCDKHELDWPIRGWKLNVRNLARLLLAPAGGKNAARCRKIRL